MKHFVSHCKPGEELECNKTDVAELINRIGHREFTSQLIMFDYSHWNLSKEMAEKIYDYWMDQSGYEPMLSIDSLFEREDIRTCDICGRPMIQGFCIDGGLEYYCSDECLHEVYTEERYLELYDDGNGNSYWTEWEEVNNE